MGKVLLVDDEVDICLLLSGILRKEGFHTSYALSLSDAVRKLGKETFEVVFLDLNLPDGVGYELIPAILRKWNGTKIVVVSAYDSEQEKARKEGADYFIAKPFRKDEIILALKELNLYS